MMRRLFRWFGLEACRVCGMTRRDWDVGRMPMRRGVVCVRCTWEQV